MTLADRSLEPDATQLEELQARRLLDLAGSYVRAALKVPDDIETLRSITANLLFENAALRWQHDQLVARVEQLERRARGGR